MSARVVPTRGSAPSGSAESRGDDSSWNRREPTFAMKIAALAFWMMFLTGAVIFLCLLQMYAPGFMGGKGRWAYFLIWIFPVVMAAAFLFIWAASWYGFFPTVLCVSTCGVYWCIVNDNCDCDCCYGCCRGNCCEDCCYGCCRGDCCEDCCDLKIISWLFCAPCVGFYYFMRLLFCCPCGNRTVNFNCIC